MPAEPPPGWLEIEPVSEATLVRLRNRSLMGDDARVAAEHLSRLAEEGHRRLVVSLAGVEFLDSALLGQFVLLHKKCQEAGGRLVLCGLSPELYHVFQLVRLTGVFAICADEAGALEAV